VSAVDRVWPWAALLRVHAAVVPRLERALAQERMPLAWYDVLLELNSAPDRRLRMTDLSARVVLSRERVSRVVDELAAVTDDEIRVIGQAFARVLEAEEPARTSDGCSGRGSGR
jgi:hypothetical protein